MTCPELDLVEGGLGLEIDAARPHEPQGPVDLAGDGLVAAALGAGGDELLVPGVDLGEIGETALGERPEQVERRRRLMVGGDHAAGVSRSRLGRGGLVVDDVAAERRDLHPAHVLGGQRAGLGELPGHPAHLDHGHARAVGEDHRHLEDDLQLVPDGVGAEVGERLGAVAGLEHEGLAP